jgi:hypothetical protein
MDKLKDVIVIHKFKNERTPEKNFSDIEKEAENTFIKEY